MTPLEQTRLDLRDAESLAPAGRHAELAVAIAINRFTQAMIEYQNYSKSLLGPAPQSVVWDIPMVSSVTDEDSNFTPPIDPEFYM